MWKRFNCKDTGLVKPDEESIVFLKQIMDNKIVNKSANLVLSLITNFLRGIYGIISIFATFYRFSKSPEDNVSNIFNWLLISIRLADISSGALLRLNKKMKELNPNSHFVDGLLKIKFTGDFKEFEKKCDELFTEEEILINSVDVATVFCYFSEFIDNMVEKDKSGLSILKPIMDLSGTINYNDFIEKTNVLEFAKKGEYYKYKSDKAKTIISDKLLKKVNEFEENFYDNARKQNELIIKNIIKMYKNHFTYDEIVNMILDNYDDVVISLANKELGKLKNTKKYKNDLSVFLNANMGLILQQIAMLKQSVFTMPATVYNQEMNILNQRQKQQQKELTEKFNKIKLNELIERYKQKNLEEYGGLPLQVITKYVKDVFKKAGGRRDLLKYNVIKEDFDKLRKELFENEILQTKKMEAVKLTKAIGFTLLKYMYLIIKYSLSLLPQRLLFLIYDETRISYFFDEILAFVAGLILGPEYLSKDSTIKSLSQIAKDYIALEMAAENPFVTSFYENNNLVLDEKFKQKKDEDVFNIFTSNKSFEELVAMNQKELQQTLTKNAIEKRNQIGIIGGQANDLDYLTNKNIRDTAIEVMGKNAKLIKRIGETAQPEIKKEIVSSLSGFMTNNVAKKALRGFDQKYADVWKTSKKKLQDKIFKILCWLSSKIHVIAANYTSYLNILLIMLYFQTKFAVIVNNLYNEYLKSSTGKTQPEKFCEWLKNRPKQSYLFRDI